MQDKTIETVVWGVVLLSAIQATAFYAVVKLLMTGKAVFERREPERGRIIGMER